MLVLMHSSSRAHYLHRPAQRYGSSTSLVLAILLDGWKQTGERNSAVSGDTVRLLAIFAMWFHFALRAGYLSVMTRFSLSTRYGANFQIFQHKLSYKVCLITVKLLYVVTRFPAWATIAAGVWSIRHQAIWWGNTLGDGQPARQGNFSLFFYQRHLVIKTAL